RTGQSRPCSLRPPQSVALSEAGFRATVAPLGTAVTEHQLAMLWRMSDEPIIALDGDTAGLRAANRVVDLALPRLEAGKAVRFALMPNGQDPDDVLKASGPDAMQGLLDGAMPLVQLLWRRETEGKIFDSPERKAALDKIMRGKLREISDPSLRGHYGEEIKRLRAELFGYGAAPAQSGFGGARAPRRPGRGWTPPAVPQATTKGSLLVTQDAVEDHVREAVILATLIATPEVLAEFDGELEMLEGHGDHAALRAALMALPLDQLTSGVAREAILARVGPGPLEKLFGLAHVAISPAVRAPGDMDMARLCLAEEFAKLSARQGHAREVADAIEDMDGLADEGLTWRLGQAAEAMNRAGRQDDDDTAEYETAPNGARLNRDE
ncbi:MAG: toprim domain-containing protein, partial [Pseudomonadota bacterium]